MIAAIVVAMFLGWAIGYERYFNGRVTGGQVYCIVCATSCAITAASGGQPLWWPTAAGHTLADPTRLAGSVITGIGFLGAGILVHTGTSVRGLSTAASIWGSSVVGILTGMGEVLPALVLTALFVTCMTALPSIERRLPARAVFAVSIKYRPDYRPEASEMNEFLCARRLAIVPESMSVTYEDGSWKMEFTVNAYAGAGLSAMDLVAKEMPNFLHVLSFTLSRSSRG